MRRAGVLLLVLSLMIGCDSREPDDRYAGTVLVLDLEGSTPTRSVLPDETLVSEKGSWRKSGSSPGGSCPSRTGRSD